VERLERECQNRGIQLVGFRSLNTVLPTARFSNFFQARIEGVETVLVVMTEEWTNTNLVTLLNIMLDIRADPDPPGTVLAFKIFSAHPVPPLLHTLFGDYRISPIECRAAMVAQFGNDLQPVDCPRLAASAMHFLASLGTRIDFRDPRGVQKIADAVIREVRSQGFPLEGTPLNFLICLGCLFGEVVRTLLPHQTEWTAVKEYLPWPCLVVRGWSRPAAGAARKMVQLGFSPIAMVIQLSQGGEAELLERSVSSLAKRASAECDLAATGDEPLVLRGEPHPSSSAAPAARPEPAPPSSPSSV
jgi:hypothetical protein